MSMAGSQKGKSSKEGKQSKRVGDYDALVGKMESLTTNSSAGEDSPRPRNKKNR